MIDKRGLLGPGARSGLVLELGCGERKQHAEAVGIDELDYDDVDVVGDVLEVVRSLADDSVDAVYSHHFFEHIDDVGQLMVELDRVIAEGGVLDVSTPHFSNPWYYSDPTHKTPFGLYTFAYFCGGSPLRRQVPRYQFDVGLEIVSLDLVFKSSPPFYVRHAFKKAWQLLFNLNRYTREFYEENLCRIIPCHDVRCVMVQRGGSQGLS